MVTIFWQCSLLLRKLDTAPVMSPAGHTDQCIEYLIGNHTIAERMFRFDPPIMLYAPLRTVIYFDHDHQTWFVTDRPSALFSSFVSLDITKVGEELDTKLQTLLRSLEVDVSIMGDSGSR